MQLSSVSTAYSLDQSQILHTMQQHHFQFSDGYDEYDEYDEFEEDDGELFYGESSDSDDYWDDSDDD